MAAVTTYLGLGANLGGGRDVLSETLRTALTRLGNVPGVVVEEVSKLRETDPVDAPGPQFLNGVAKLSVTLPPHALLGICKQLEREAGRDLNAPRNSPRPLDLDILLYGDARIDTRDLVVPHPRMFARAFVMDPLSELMDVGGLVRPEHPRVIDDPTAFAALHTTWLHGGCLTGLVPTMGALHEGHLSLIRAARRECDRVSVTIFVNPLQFGAGEDLDAYPRTLEEDLAKVRDLEVDAVFVPRRGTMYPEGFCTTVTTGVEAKTMEGATRPTHFEGVTTVVAKLFGLARPSRAYFGQKDAQQVAVLRRMAQDLDYSLELCVCPIVREPDGLAMSSRNTYLDAEDRVAASVLYRGLCAARDAFAAGERDAAQLLAHARRVVEAEPRVRLDYLVLRREGDLQPLPPGPVENGRVLIAGYMGEPSGKVVRLLDNMALQGDEALEFLSELPD